MSNPTIWDARFVCVHASLSENLVQIDRYTTGQFRRENRGNREFVRRVLQNVVILGVFYDDSDMRYGVLCWYAPVNEIQIVAWDTPSVLRCNPVKLYKQLR